MISRNIRCPQWGWWRERRRRRRRWSDVVVVVVVVVVMLVVCSIVGPLLMKNNWLPTDGPTDRPTDWPTYRLIDIPSCRDSWTHLKRTKTKTNHLLKMQVRHSKPSLSQRQTKWRIFYWYWDGQTAGPSSDAQTDRSENRQTHPHIDSKYCFFSVGYSTVVIVQ